MVIAKERIRNCKVCLKEIIISNNNKFKYTYISNGWLCEECIKEIENNKCMFPKIPLEEYDRLKRNHQVRKHRFNKKQNKIIKEVKKDEKL